MSQKKEITFLNEAQLNKLDTKRLLALKRSVTAKQSALFNRNIESLPITHPFDVAKLIVWDYDQGNVIDHKLIAVIDDYREFNGLTYYYNKIKEILSTRENVN
jgi:hypothetical protein